MFVAEVAGFSSMMAGMFRPLMVAWADIKGGRRTVLGPLSKHAELQFCILQFCVQFPQMRANSESQNQEMNEENPLDSANADRSWAQPLFDLSPLPPGADFLFVF